MQAIKKLKVAWGELAKSPPEQKAWSWRLRTEEDWAEARRAWGKIRYFRESNTLTKPLTAILENAPTGGLTKAKLIQAIKAYPAVTAVWGSQFDQPEKLHRLVEKSDTEPTYISDINGWIFKGIHYEVSGAYSVEEASLLVLREFDREREYFEHLSQRYQVDSESVTEPERKRIPERVRIEVWRRDGGKCARCGSRENLEYDHIVPVSKGGGNSARNIELLCEKCNRHKGASIG